jgi:hypothetical protein
MRISTRKTGETEIYAIAQVQKRLETRSIWLLSNAPGSQRTGRPLADSFILRLGLPQFLLFSQPS